MAKKAQTASTETLEPRIYEIGYLLSPAVRDEDLTVRVNELKESLTKLGANIFAEGNAEFIDLAYEMSRVIDNKRVRFNQGYFGWLKFEIDPSKSEELKEVLDKNTLLVRYLLIKAIRENTVIGKKSLGKILRGERNDDVVEEAAKEPAEAEVADVPVEKLDEALDEEIKELVKEA